MPRQRPETVDPWRLADSGERVGGRLPVAAMPRLVSLLHDAQGTATIELHGCRDQTGRRLLRGVVRASVNLCCQRCLGSFPLLLEQPVSLALVETLGQARDLPTEHDPLLVPFGERIDPGELLCDELILALPVVARHADVKECESGDASAHELDPSGAIDGQDRQHPFAGLRELMKGTSESEQE